MNAKRLLSARQMTNNARFVAAWDTLAEQAKCDSRGGAEYRRVRREWRIAGKPDDVSAFIVWRANLGLAEFLRERAAP